MFNEFCYASERILIFNYENKTAMLINIKWSYLFFIMLLL